MKLLPMEHQYWRSKIIIFTIYFSNHPHPLKFVDRTGKFEYGFSGWRCNVCRTSYPANFKNWYCRQCKNYDICRSCLKFDRYAGIDAPNLCKNQ